MKGRNHHKKISFFLILCMMLTLIPGQAFGEIDKTSVTGSQNASETVTEPEPTEDPGQGQSEEGIPDSDPGEDGENPNIVLTEFTSLALPIQNQRLYWGAKESAIEKPTMLKAADASGNSYILTGVKWVSEKPFDGRKNGTYIFTPQLPEGYEPGENAVLPEIKVTVERRKTTVTGVNRSRSLTAGKSLTDTVTVTPAYGRQVKLQRWNRTNQCWVTKATFTTSNTLKDTITLRYPKAWYETSASTWRVYVYSTQAGTHYAGQNISVKAKRAYQNPSKYLQIQESIKVEASGGYSLKRGTMGLKVAKVQRKLGMGRRWEIMDSSTISRVKSFQRRHGIRATGVVDLRTWKAMGFSESSWYSLGKYIPEVKTDLASTRKDCIETMIKTAKSYLGDEYIVGAAGKPGTGVDCSGLIMQSLYSAGINPLPVSVVRHSQPGYEYESRNLWSHKKLKHVSYSDRKRGDLIFYRGRGGAIIHVAIYLGDNKVIESWPDKVVIWPVKNSRRSYIAGVVRPFV